MNKLKTFLCTESSTIFSPGAGEFYQKKKHFYIFHLKQLVFGCQNRNKFCPFSSIYTWFNAVTGSIVKKNTKRYFSKKTLHGTVVCPFKNASNASFLYWNDGVFQLATSDDLNEKIYILGKISGKDALVAGCGETGCVPLLSVVCQWFSFSPCDNDAFRGDKVKRRIISTANRYLQDEAAPRGES